MNLGHEPDSCILYLETIVCPTAEFHLTVLVIERKPGDVYLTSGFENPRRDVSAGAGAGDYYIGGVRSIKRFTRTEKALS